MCHSGHGAAETLELLPLPGMSPGLLQGPGSLQAPLWASCLLLEITPIHDWSALLVSEQPSDRESG